MTAAAASIEQPEQTGLRHELRPARVEPVLISPFNSAGDKPRQIIKDQTGTRYVLTNQVGVRLIELFDGQRTLVEIQRAFAEHYRIELELEKIERFADLCHRNNLLVPESWVALEPQPAVRRHGNLGFYRRLFVAERLLDWLVARRVWWCNPLTGLLAAALLLAALAFALGPSSHRLELTAPLMQVQGHPSDLLLLLLPLLFFVELALHELAHAVACRLFGARSGGFGFGLLWGVMPICFTDTTDAYTIDNKYQRMAISAAGPLVDALALGLAALVAWSSPPDALIGRLAVAYSAFPLSMLLINLNPFLIRMDGYWILSDWLEQPNLRQTALDYLGRQARRLIARPAPADSLADRTREHWKWPLIYTIYGVIALTWTVSFVLLFLFSLARAAQRLLALF